MQPGRARRSSLEASDPRLQAWVEKIWAPHGDTPVSVSLGAAPSGHVVVEEYAVLPHPRTARFLVPMGSRAATVASFATYSRTRAPVSRSLRTALAGGYAVGLADRVFPHRLVVSVDRRFPVRRLADALVLRHLAEALGRSELWAFTAVRGVNPNAKPTLELFDSAGEPAGYAKLGTTEATRTMVRTEVEAMTALSGRLGSVVVPRLLARGDWSRTTYAVSGPLPRDLRRWSQAPESALEALSSIARSGRVVRRRLAGSEYAAALQSDIRSSRPFGQVPDALEAWLQRLEHRPAPLEFGRMHGDWIPDNLGRSAGRIVAWDWEHSSPQAPIGFDFLHWHFHRVFVRQGLPAAVRELDRVGPRLVALGVPVESHHLLSSLYLLDVFVRRLKLAAGGGGWSKRWYPGLLEVAQARDLS